MSDNDVEVKEVVKKPSGGLSYSRKLNTGEKYENEELEIWGSTGSLDSIDYEDFRENLSNLADELVEEMEERVKEIQRRDQGIPSDWNSQLEDVMRAINAGDKDKAVELIKDMRSDLE